MGGTFPVGTQLQGYALGMVTMKYTSFPSVTSGKMEKKRFLKISRTYDLPITNKASKSPTSCAFKAGWLSTTEFTNDCACVRFWRVNASFEFIRESHERLSITTLTNKQAQDRFSENNNKSHKLSTPSKLLRELNSSLKTLKMAMCLQYHKYARPCF